MEFAHPLDGGRAAVVTRSVAETAARLGADGRSYRRLLGPMARHVDDICAELLQPLRRPPAHPLVMAGYGSRGILPASALVRRWRTPEARAIMGGAAAHAMLPLTAVPTGGIGLMLIALAHGVGWPVVEGGSARITDAMADAVVTAGGSIETGRWVRSLAELPTATAVLLDVSPRDLADWPATGCPAGTAPRCAGSATAPASARWTSPCPARCRGPTRTAAGPAPCTWAGRSRRWPRPRPRSPRASTRRTRTCSSSSPGSPTRPGPRPGSRRCGPTATCPAGSDVDMTDRIEAQIERFAPGFRDLILARAVRTAADEEAHNPNYVGGDIAVGMQTMRQTVFRPTIQWNPYRTPIRGVYLCSSATPPVPGVHGRCGELAALTALRDVFGIREAPDISPARLRPAANVSTRPAP